MKQKFTFLILLFLSFYINGQNPPGTINLSGQLYIDIAPIDNIMFIEYLDIKKKFTNRKLDSIIENSKNYKLDRSDIFNNIEIVKNSLDSLNVYIINSNDEYLRNPKYSKYPAINISKSDAIDFCKWRTKMVLLNYAMISSSENERKKYPKNIQYRIPSNEEFNMALRTFGYSKGHKSNEQHIPFKIYRKKYKSNYKKAIFIQNNLSELTLNSEPFGNNWKNEKPSNQGNDYTSFRCICEIID